MTYRPDDDISGKLDNADYMVPNSVTANVGSLTGTVSDLQTMEDGNELIINEIAGAPPGPFIDTDIDFTGVEEIYGLVLRSYYDGNHYVTVNMRNYDTSSDDLLIREDNGSNYGIRTILIPADIQADYITSNTARISILHDTSGGNVAHDFHIDYIALLGKST